ncbi:MAG: hypothetical protein Q8L36_02410 [bacterium]|nr:hypothetical protein [bacterium]
MNYSVITQELIEKRFDVLPEKVRETLDSEKNQEKTKKICAENFLNEEQSLIVEQLTALILLGFVSPKQLQSELIINAGLTEENSAKISGAIKENILAEAGNDLGRVYSPLTEPTSDEIKTEAAKETVAIRTPVDAVAYPPTKTATEPAPFVLYQDNQQKQPTEERKPLNRPFSFSFNIFKSQNNANSKSQVQAKIETNEGKKEVGEARAVKVILPHRTVHYSEFRSPVSPFGGNTITNLEMPEGQTQPAPITNESPLNSPTNTEPKNDEGVIDLRNL